MGELVPNTSKDDVSLNTEGYLKLLSPDEFIDSIKDVLDGGRDNEGDLYYRFTFKPNETSIEKQEADKGKLLHSPEDLEIIKDQYTKMSDLLSNFVDKGCKITRLVIINSQGLCGVSFEYLNRSDRTYSSRYIRDFGATDLIPKDFLHDLHHIPNRAH